MEPQGKSRECLRAESTGATKSEKSSPGSWQASVWGFRDLQRIMYVLRTAIGFRFWVILGV